MLLTLINNVLDLSKIEAGKFQLHPHATDIKQTVQETVEMFSALAADKGIALTFEVDEANLRNIDIDAPRLRQVMMNLVSNAVKYTELGGVVLRAQMLPSMNANVRDLRFMVIDSGVGIPDEQRGRIFEPFHQADSPDGKIRQGTGLGLSITRRLVDMMEGRISVESEVGKGSTFIVDIPQLPVSTTPATPPARDEQLVDFNRLRPLKILVVDDMAWNAQVAQGYLGKSHHRVFVASDGIDGVAAAKKLHPDVVLMDLRMPRMNGFEARDAIRADPDLTDTSIVAVTASSLGGEEHSLRASFDGYIRKPFTPIDLFIALQAIFGASAAAEPMQLGIANLTAPPQNVTPQLQQRWFGLRAVQLIELRRTMRMREISSFALELGVLGRDLGWPKLIEYAASLGNAVRRFDIVSVKKILGELTGWPEDLFDES